MDTFASAHVGRRRWRRWPARQLAREVHRPARSFCDAAQLLVNGPIAARIRSERSAVVAPWRCGAAERSARTRGRSPADRVSRKSLICLYLSAAGGRSAALECVSNETRETRPPRLAFGPARDRRAEISARALRVAPANEPQIVAQTSASAALPAPPQVAAADIELRRFLSREALAGAHLWARAAGAHRFGRSARRTRQLRPAHLAAGWPIRSAPASPAPIRNVDTGKRVA